MRAHRKSLKPIMGPGSAFDCPVILLDDVIQVLALSDPDARFPLSVDGLEGGEIGPAFIHGHGLIDLFRLHARQRNRHRRDRLCRLIARSAKHRRCQRRGRGNVGPADIGEMDGPALAARPNTFGAVVKLSRPQRKGGRKSIRQKA
jgi:hypothetical protein